MEVLTKLIAINRKIYEYQIMMLYILNYIVCKYYLNKAGKRN